MVGHGTTCHCIRSNGGTILLSGDRERNTRECERLEPRTLVRSWWCAHSASLLCRTHQKTLAANPSGGNAVNYGVWDSILLNNLIDTLLFSPSTCLPRVPPVIYSYIMADSEAATPNALPITSHLTVCRRLVEDLPPIRRWRM